MTELKRSRFRKTCEKKGHKFAPPAPGVMLPYVFCHRWFCHASSVSIYAPVTPEVAVAMHNAIPWEDRFPQVELELIAGKVQDKENHA